MTLRLLACILGAHVWVSTIGPSTYTQACAHCAAPRTR